MAITYVDVTDALLHGEHVGQLAFQDDAVLYEIGGRWFAPIEWWLARCAPPTTWVEARARSASPLQSHPQSILSLRQAAGFIRRNVAGCPSYRYLLHLACGGKIPAIHRQVGTVRCRYHISIRALTIDLLSWSGAERRYRRFRRNLHHFAQRLEFGIQPGKAGD